MIFWNVSKSCIFLILQREAHTEFYNSHIEPILVLLTNPTSVALKKGEKKERIKPQLPKWDLPEEQKYEKKEQKRS